jgi:hypothetical protein
VLKKKVEKPKEKPVEKPQEKPVDPEEAEALKLYNEAIAKGINPADIGNDAGDLVSGSDKKNKADSKVESDKKEKVDDLPAPKKNSDSDTKEAKKGKNEKDKPESINSGLEEDAINFLHEEADKRHAAAKDAEALQTATDDKMS